MKGTISSALVNKTRAKMGLTRNLRGKTTSQGSPRKRGRQPADAFAAARLDSKPRQSARVRVLIDLEADIDRLLFKVMGIGGLADVAEALRAARRLLYMSGRS